MLEDPPCPTAAASPESSASVRLHGNPPADASAAPDASPSGPGGAGPSGTPASAAPSASKPGSAEPAPPVRDFRRPSFYQTVFNDQELQLIAALAADPTPEDEFWLVRVLNRRLMSKLAPETPPGQPAEALDGLLKIAREVSGGASRVAALLRALRAMGRASFETAPEAVREAARALSQSRQARSRS
jgi:hypothetical protein